MVQQDSIGGYLQGLHRINQIYERGGDPNKKYNIMFYGAGNVAIESVQSLINSNLPIKDIFLVGRNKESTTYNLERITEELNNSFGDCGTKVIGKFSENVGELLPQTDLFFFTADANDPNETNRGNMINANLPLVEGISKYFNKDFKGIINFTSNLPEVLAHYAATKFNIPDVRQITAHVPLDLMRYEHIVRSSILNNERYESLDLVVVGYHDLPYIVTNGSKLIKRMFIENGAPGREEINISHKLEKHRGLLQSVLGDYAMQQFKLQEKELQSKELSRREGPTTISTGMAVANFITAVVNRGETTTAIPYEIDGRQFFIDLPVTFLKGYPQLDIERFERLDDPDLKQLHDRIDGPNSAVKYKPLSQIVGETLGKDCNFNIPRGTRILDTIFNPYGKKIKIEKKVIEIRQDSTEQDKEIEKLKEEMCEIKQGGGTSKEIDELRKRINGLEDKKERISELKEELIDSLDADIYLPSSNDKLKIVRYTLSKNLIPVATKYELNLRGIVKKDLSYEHSKMSLFDYGVSGDELYVLANRSHDNKKKEYRLFIFDEKTGKRKEVSEPIVGDSLFEIGTMKMSERDVIFSKKDKEGAHLCKYSIKNNELIPFKKTSDLVDLIIPYKNKEFLFIEDQIKIDDKLIHRAKSNCNGFYKVLEKKDLLFYTTNNSIHVYDIKQDYDLISFPSHGYLNDIIETEQGLQMITGGKESELMISNYESKKDLFENKGEVILLKNDNLKNLTRIYVQDQNMIYGAKDPNQFFALYHKASDIHIEPINISRFNSLEGELK
ncbi:hypothetical protein ISS04_02505 [Candidatus Woesearchaeota archaeon]|nr:hypothetical protein [Candidatus Woesearchaeota archaeon]